MTIDKKQFESEDEHEEEKKRAEEGVDYEQRSVSDESISSSSSFSSFTSNIEESLKSVSNSGPGETYSFKAKTKSVKLFKLV